MENEQEKSKEITNNPKLREVIYQFSKDLVATQQYRDFENAIEEFQKDAAAQNALKEYQAFAQGLQTKQLFNNFTTTERSDLDRLWINFQSYPTVKRYFSAQEEFQTLCHSCAQVISKSCRLDFATSCGASCCG